MIPAGLLRCLAALALAICGAPQALGQASGAAETGVGACAAWVQQTGLPQVKAGGDGEILVCRTGYLLSFNPERRVANWVLEVLTPERFAPNATRDNLAFLEDPAAGGRSARSQDYTNSGFDRGHMAPAADHTWLEQAMRESFYLTNIAPQHGPKMNRGIWKDLEARARDWTVVHRRLLVFSGPIFGAKPREIGGDRKVAVPDGFFKIVYNPATGRVIAFRFDNKPYDKPDLDPNRRSVRDVEHETGITFFPGLPARARRVLTTQVAPMWR